MCLKDCTAVRSDSFHFSSSASTICFPLATFFVFGILSVFWKDRDGKETCICHGAKIHMEYLLFTLFMVIRVKKFDYFRFIIFLHIQLVLKRGLHYKESDGVVASKQVMDLFGSQTEVKRNIWLRSIRSNHTHGLIRNIVFYCLKRLKEGKAFHRMTLRNKVA